MIQAGQGSAMQGVARPGAERPGTAGLGTARQFTSWDVEPTEAELASARREMGL